MLNRPRLPLTLAAAVIATGVSVALMLLQAPVAAGAADYHCWDPSYRGGFSWSADGQYNFGWHTPHQSNEPCTAVSHGPGCDCEWCTSVDPELRSGSPAHWCNSGSCCANWCDGTHWDATADGPWWFAHGPDCECGWCRAYTADPRGDRQAMHPPHSRGCSCGWCSGGLALDQPAPDKDGFYHAWGCGCWWCTSAADPEATDSTDTPQRRGGHGCCCGCCR